MRKISFSLILLLTAYYNVFSDEYAELNFRDSIMINDTVVTLGELAEIKCSNRVLSDSLYAFKAGDAAPAGYSRFIGCDDLITYQIKPKFKGVNLVQKGSKRTVLTTSYRNLSVASVIDSITDFLDSAIKWPKGSWTVSVTNEGDMFKVLDKPFHVEFGDLLSSCPRGRFSFQMSVIQGAKAVRVPVRCEIKVSAPVVIARKTIMRGEVVSPSACEVSVIDITHYGILPCDSLSKVVGKKALRQITPGVALSSQWLEQIPDIEKGDPVRLETGKNLVRVAVDAIARESGSAGDKIWVQNVASHKMVRVVVTEKGKVKAL